MKNIVVTLFALLFFSCSKNERKEFYIDKVKKGMITQEVKEILGNPIDSTQYKNYEGELILRYDYKEGNFSDYGLNVIFNDSYLVIDYYYD